MERRRIGQGIAVTLAGAAAGGLAWGWRRHRGDAQDADAAQQRGNGHGTGQLSPVEEYVCACGQQFRVVGIDRHRVYWVEGAPEEDPVLSGACPNCERPLPA
jgi:hypothetical protein